MFVYVVSVCDTFERECYIRVFSNEKGAKDFFEKEVKEYQTEYCNSKRYDCTIEESYCYIDYESTFADGTITIEIEKQEVLESY